MKLAQIVNAGPAWQALASLKKEPQLAYDLLQYEKKVQGQLDICAKQKDRLVYESAGVEPPTPPDVLIVQLEPGSEGFKAFNIAYGEFLNTESVLRPVGLTMAEVFKGLRSEGKGLTEGEIEMLEPFFKEAAEPSA